MKTTIKTLLPLCMVIWVSIFSTHAQFQQFEEKAADLPQSSTTPNWCRCEGPSLDFLFSPLIFADQYFQNIKERKRIRAFRSAFEQDTKTMMENRLGRSFDNFRDASLAYFDAFTGGFERRQAVSGIKSFIGDRDNDWNLVADELNALNQRATELNSGNIDNPYLGAYRVEGRALSSIKTLSDLNNIRNITQNKYTGLNNYFNTEVVDNLLLDTYNTNVYVGSRRLTDKELKNHMSEVYHTKYIFRSVTDPFGAANMLRDWILAFSNYESGLGTTADCPLNSCGKNEFIRSFLRDDSFFYDYADAGYETSKRLGRDSGTHSPGTRSLESLRNEGAFRNLGPAANSYINRNRKVREAVSNYFDHYNYNEASQDCVNYLFQKVLGDGDFAPDTNDYKSNKTPICRSVGTPNTALDMEWKPSSIELGYQGFQNIMAELNNIPENHGKIGHIIKDMLSANGKALPGWMDDILVGRYFNFSIVPANAAGAQIEFRDGFGTEAWNDGLTTNDGIYEHIRRVDFIGAKLELNDLQIDILLDASGFVKELFDFLNSNLDNPAAIEFGKQAVDRFNEGGDVDFDCNDPQPNKLSFCKKVWYLDKDGDGYYSEMTEAETRPGINWFENLTEKDCDDNNPSVFKLNKCKKCEAEPEDGKCTECPEGYVLNDFGDCKKKCPDEDRKKDSNDGFFTEIRTINGEDVAVKKATFSVNTVGGLSQSDINEMAEGVSKIYANGSMPMDLEMTVDEENSDNGSFKIKFITDKAQRIELNETTWAYDFTAGVTEIDKNGNITVSVVRNLNLFDENGKFIRVVVFDNETIAGTLSHELGHALGLQHHWIDFPDKNTEENKFNFMNSEDNPDEELKTVEGENILPEQKNIIENKLKQQQRDGNDC